jgi:ABC-type nitrate/sulfonate/bicarbonate transport system substrate-binding protein
MGVKLGAHVLATSEDLGYVYTMWASASGPWLDTHKSEAKAFLAAMAEANSQIAADPVAASEDLYAETKLAPADTLPLLKLVNWALRDFAPRDYESADKIADFLAAQKITPTRVDFRKSIMPGFYSE